MLRVAEIFRSLQGESTRTGWPCTFVRLAGCNLHCRWCDTEYARAGGEQMSLEQICREVGRLGQRRVEVTGGEPLCQADSVELMARLCRDGWEVLLETNGSLDISPVPAAVRRIVDCKCPSSGESGSNRLANLDLLTDGDEVKFVCADRGDFEFAEDLIVTRSLTDRCPVTLSPVAGKLDPAQLAGWILDARLDVRLGLQLHKILWPGLQRGV
jgi:7-carboxy-7-deazaguanine synthase